ncbi:MAG: hypothetical protein A3K19_21835 [Lentisphaerae bacterium RIFOXYB12_FULL_65_16]|nr:MAG: hypothetical protein A3K18_04415 [Lentisphaerae bacterium RIFOXYA12_64_32]OGV93899.1 MAG: hypothetical protein A3K19_21835 [Lentisphaerae bacterium RIFOXYB12_FULL_65_16]
MLTRRFAQACLTLCLVAPALYGVRIESGCMTAEIGPLVSHVALGPQRILELEPFYLADQNWKTIANFGDPQPETTTADVVVTQRAAKTAPIAGEAIYTLTETGIRIEQSLEIKPDSGAYYAAQGFYLARSVFGDAPLTRNGEALHLDPAAWKTTAVDHVTVATTLGDWEFILTADGGIRWELWSMCGRTWGPEERKTFAFVYLFKDVPAAGLKLHLTFEARFLPKPGWATTVDRLIAEQATTTMRQLLAQYGGQVPDDALPRDPVQRADAVARRVMDATADLDPTGLDPRSGIIIPEPKERRWGRGAFAVPAKLDVACTAAHAAASDVIAAELARFGVGVNRVDPSGSAAVLLGVASTDAAVGAACKRLGCATTAPEGYVLHVTPHQILIAGTDDRGVLYGAQALRQLIRARSQPESWFARQLRSWHGANSSVAEVPAVTVTDWPDLKVRGFMVEAPSRVTQDEFSRLLRDVYSYFRANLLLYEVRWSRYRWQSHPEIAADNALDMRELATAADTARRYGMRFVPYVNLYGKVQELLKAHPEIAEDPDGAKKGGDHAYCPSKPETYKLVFDLLTELVEVTRCDAILSSHDEIGGMVVCPACKAVPPDDLFANDVNKTAAFLAGKGVETMIAGDMLLEKARWEPLGVDACNSGSPQYGGLAIHPAVDKLRKDVIILDWHYNTAKSYPTFKHFADHGLRVIGLPWHGNVNNYYIAKAIHEIGQLGIIDTDFGFLNTRSPVATSMLGVACAWNTSMPEPDTLAWSPQRVLAAAVLGNAQPSRTSGAKFAPIDLDAAANRPLVGGTEAWLGEGRQSDLTYFPKGVVRLFGTEYHIGDRGIVIGKENASLGISAQSARIAVNAKARALVFLHGLAVDNPAVWLQTFGQYSVTYASGERAEIAITSRNATHWRTATPRVNPWMPWVYGYAWDALLAWEGCTKGGDAVALLAYEWTNPRPDDTIVSVDASAKQDVPGLVLGLVALTAVQ